MIFFFFFFFFFEFPKSKKCNRTNKKERDLSLNEESKILLGHLPCEKLPVQNTHFDSKIRLDRHVILVVLIPFHGIKLVICKQKPKLET